MLTLGMLVVLRAKLICMLARFVFLLLVNSHGFHTDCNASCLTHCAISCRAHPHLSVLTVHHCGPPTSLKSVLLVFAASGEERYCHGEGY